MRAIPVIRRAPLAARMWFGLAGAPLSWAAEHVSGIMFTQADCANSTKTGGFPFDRWAIVMTAVTATLALLALLCALDVLAEARESDYHSAPPLGRTNFLATIGATVAPLFLILILMSGIAAVLISGCHQS